MESGIDLKERSSDAEDVLNLPEDSGSNINQNKELNIGALHGSNEKQVNGHKNGANEQVNDRQNIETLPDDQPKEIKNGELSSETDLNDNDDKQNGKSHVKFQAIMRSKSSDSKFPSESESDSESSEDQDMEEMVEEEKYKKLLDLLDSNDLSSDLTLDILKKPGKLVEVSPNKQYVRYNELLGEGSFKKVYLAYDTKAGFEVAWNIVKMKNMKGAQQLRIIQEMKILQSLEHPSIMKFYCSWFDKKSNTLVFVTEVMSSGTLKDFVMNRPVRLRIVKKWCRQILDALVYLHEVNQPAIIHRDLKCDNIFINGSSGEIRIGDLGLASWDRTGNAKSVLGTPEYMAPEMFEENYDEKVDIYAFGMCVLEMISKETPYSECTSTPQIYRKVMAGNPPDVFNQVKEGQLKSFVYECIRKVDYNESDSQSSTSPRPFRAKRPSASEMRKHPFLTEGDSADDDTFSGELLKKNDIPSKPVSDDGKGSTANTPSPVSKPELERRSSVKVQPTAQSPKSNNAKAVHGSMIQEKDLKERPKSPPVTPRDKTKMISKQQSSESLHSLTSKEIELRAEFEDINAQSNITNNNVGQNIKVTPSPKAESKKGITEKEKEKEKFDEEKPPLPQTISIPLEPTASLDEGDADLQQSKEEQSLHWVIEVESQKVKFPAFDPAPSPFPVGPGGLSPLLKVFFEHYQDKSKVEEQSRHNGHGTDSDSEDDNPTYSASFEFDALGGNPASIASVIIESTGLARSELSKLEESFLDIKRRFLAYKKKQEKEFESGAIAKIPRFKYKFINMKNSASLMRKPTPEISMMESISAMQSRKASAKDAASMAPTRVNSEITAHQQNQNIQQELSINPDPKVVMKALSPTRPKGISQDSLPNSIALEKVVMMTNNPTDEIQSNFAFINSTSPMLPGDESTNKDFKRHKDKVRNMFKSLGDRIKEFIDGLDEVGSYNIESVSKAEECANVVLSQLETARNLFKASGRINTLESVSFKTKAGDSTVQLNGAFDQAEGAESESKLHLSFSAPLASLPDFIRTSNDHLHDMAPSISLSNLKDANFNLNDINLKDFNLDDLTVTKSYSMDNMSGRPLGANHLQSSADINSTNAGSRNNGQDSRMKRQATEEFSQASELSTGSSHSQPRKNNFKGMHEVQAEAVVAHEIDDSVAFDPFQDDFPSESVDNLQPEKRASDFFKYLRTDTSTDNLRDNLDGKKSNENSDSKKEGDLLIIASPEKESDFNDFFMDDEKKN